MIRASGDVLIRVEMERGAAFLGSASKIAAAGTTFEFEPLFEVPPRSTPGLELHGRAARGAVWHLARPSRPAAESAWDTAYELARQAAAKGATVTHAEPDLIQEWPIPPQTGSGLGLESDRFKDQSGEGGKARVAGVLWVP